MVFNLRLLVVGVICKLVSVLIVVVEIMVIEENGEIKERNREGIFNFFCIFIFLIDLGIIYVRNRFKVV